MKFPYIKIPSHDPNRKWYSRPLIPIELTGPADRWRGLALIDSGADLSLFNIEIAKDIGLDLVDAPIMYFRGIEGGRIPTFIKKMKITIMGSDMGTVIQAGFTDSPNVSAILGQQGFFDDFRIKFERKRKIVELHRSD